jgi:hypothetical protein
MSINQSIAKKLIRIGNDGRPGQNAPDIRPAGTMRRNTTDSIAGDRERCSKPCRSNLHIHNPDQRWLQKEQSELLSTFYKFKPNCMTVQWWLWRHPVDPVALMLPLSQRLHLACFTVANCSPSLNWNSLRFSSCPSDIE